jgi:iron(III) transport system permease protein
VRAGEAGWQRSLEILSRPRSIELLVTSVGLTIAVCCTCLLLGTATAWLLASCRLPAGRLLLILSALPLAVPSYVAAFGWLATVPGLNGFVPAWLLLSAVCTPYVTLPVHAALHQVDTRLLDVARSYGHGPLGAWRRAVLPQVLPSALAGTLLVALYVLADYGLVAAFRLPVFTYAIQRNYQSFLNRDVAVVLALVLVVLAMLVVALERLVRLRGRRWTSGSGTRTPLARIDAGRATVPVVAFLLIVPTVAILVPTLALVRRLIGGSTQSLAYADLLAATGTTALVALWGGLLAVVVALPIGMMAARHRGRLVAVIEAGGFTGHALPGMVVALSLIFFSLRTVPSLYQTLAVLVFAYAVLFLPKSIGATRTAVEQVPPILPEVARSLGRGPLAALRATTWRLASPGIATGALLVTLTIMKELPTTLLLRPTGTETLATELWSRMSTSAYGAAAPYALTLMLVAAGPAFLLAHPRAWRGRR